MSNELPLVCICIPTYNAAITIRETLASILAQTYANLVIHVSDNASTDGTLSVIESMTDSRVTIHRHVENVGGEGNFNRCIQLAEGKYTAIYHADDVYEPNIVASQVEFLEAHPNAGAVFTEANIIDAMGYITGEILLPKGIAQQGGLYDFDTMFKAVLRHSNFFICPSFMVPTQIYKQEINCWRGELFGSSSDLDVWFRILQRHPIGHIPDRLLRYRICLNQFSAKIRSETERAAIFKVLDHYLKLDRVKAVIDSTDLLLYKWLERRDRVMRGVNLFLLDRPEETMRLLSDIYSQDTLKAAFKSKRGLFVLIVGVYMKMLIVMGLNGFGKASLNYIKQVAHK